MAHIEMRLGNLYAVDSCEEIFDCIDADDVITMMSYAAQAAKTLGNTDLADKLIRFRKILRSEWVDM